MGLQVLISIFIENVLMFVVKKIHLTIRNAVDQERNRKYNLKILKKHLLESEVEEYEIQIFNRTVCFSIFSIFWICYCSLVKRNKRILKPWVISNKLFHSILVFYLHWTISYIVYRALISFYVWNNS